MSFPNYKLDDIVHAPTIYPAVKGLTEPYEGVNVLCSVFIRVEYCDETTDAVTCLECLAKGKVDP